MDINIAEEAHNTAKRDFLRDIEVQVQKKWDQDKTFEYDAPTQDDGVESWIGTFPYPYMNGKLHLGHGFTVMKVDFAAGYERLKGKRALFPFAFHGTGMPISAAAEKISYEIDTYGNPPVWSGGTENDKTNTKKLKAKAAQKQGSAKFQWEILRSSGIPDTEIGKFADPHYWLKYFPEETEKSLRLAGCKIDWRRSFVTTEVNPYYDAFVQWQFRKLKNQGRIKFGKRYAIYSVKENGPCMDDNRSSGEGVGISEYTIIKQRVLKPYPECLAHLERDPRPIYLVPATLRPETMAGQTNCWVDPDGVYGAFSMKDDQIFLCTKRSALNMAYQNLAAQERVVEQLAEFTGAQLIGTAINAPLTPNEVIYVLPMFGVSTDKTTGVVTSVPSDSPEDFAAFRDLKTKPALREKYAIKDEWIMDFEVIPIISIEGYGECAAVTVVDRMKIKSQNDTIRLYEAKAEVYLKGNHFGVMTSGKYTGVPVKEAKEQIKEDLINEGHAYIYSEPESKVVSRSGDTCIVALCDQWYLNYADEEWKERVRECVAGMNFYTDDLRKAFEHGVEWIKEHACSRSFGLGTKIPWDPQYLIDSFSDSTIYMIFYTIAHYLQGNIDGSAPGLADLAPDVINDEFFDYVFCGTSYPENCPIPEETLQKIRNEVLYWYPVDLRNSGKDLINNHLLFYIFNHVSLFSKEFWPKSIRANGHLILNAVKMSKGKGIFITLKDAVNRYSADGMRFTLADAGDQIEDANFMSETADSVIKKLWHLIDWITTIRESDNTVDREPSNFQERLFAAEIDNAITQTIGFYEEMRYKDVMKSGYFDLVNAKDEYLKIVENLNEPINTALIEKFIDTIAKLMAPITSHISEYIWQNLGGNEGSVFDAGLPVPVGVEDTPSMMAARDYVKNTLKKARKQKKNIKDKEITTLNIHIFDDVPAWKVEAVTLVQSLMTDNTFPAKKTIAQHTGKNMKNVMPFIAELEKRYNEFGLSAFSLELPFDEEEIWKLLTPFLKSDLPIEYVQFTIVSEEDKKTNNTLRNGGRGSPCFIFE
eukprot:TRINITY_DN1249_c0_g1_i1.p1 TRINITY_DN1249_c0_g1~~TRINITY_DN1249_c0_g1_i1.p1  ORF type:complete len:1041 (-),score=299.21 TRINITY_DN1249_c0_g1_i1:37-3159(-)